MKDGVSVLTAISILGEKKVVRASSLLPAHEVYKHTEKTIFADTGYTQEELESAADANRKGLANWYLIYYRGKSPKQILDERFESKFGFGEVERFDKNHWFSHSNESYWTEKAEEPGYYLLNFVGEEDEYRELRFENLTFSEQEKRIALLSGKERAPFHIVLDAVFSIFDVHRTLVLKHWNHLTNTRINDGSLLYLGATNSKASGEIMMNVFKFPQEQENDPKYYYGFGAVLLHKKQ